MSGSYYEQNRLRRNLKKYIDIISENKFENEWLDIRNIQNLQMGANNQSQQTQADKVYTSFAKQLFVDIYTIVQSMDDSNMNNHEILLYYTSFYGLNFLFTSSTTTTSGGDIYVRFNPVGDSSTTNADTAAQIYSLRCLLTKSDIINFSYTYNWRQAPGTCDFDQFINKIHRLLNINVGNVNPDVKTVIENWVKDGHITLEEACAVYIYTQNGSTCLPGHGNVKLYDEINRILRGEFDTLYAYRRLIQQQDLDISKRQFRLNTRLLFLLYVAVYSTSAIRKISDIQKRDRAESIYLYRSMGQMGDQQLVRFCNIYKPGSLIRINQLLSAVKDEIWQYTSRVPGCLLKIKCDKEVKYASIKEISSCPSEDEVIISPHQILHVLHSEFGWLNDFGFACGPSGQSGHKVLFIYCEVLTRGNLSEKTSNAKDELYLNAITAIDAPEYGIYKKVTKNPKLNQCQKDGFVDLYTEALEKIKGIVNLPYGANQSAITDYAMYKAVVDQLHIMQLEEQDRQATVAMYKDLSASWYEPSIICNATEQNDNLFYPLLCYPEIAGNYFDFNSTASPIYTGRDSFTNLLKVALNLYAEIRRKEVSAPSHIILQNINIKTLFPESTGCFSSKTSWASFKLSRPIFGSPSTTTNAIEIYTIVLNNLLKCIFALKYLREKTKYPDVNKYSERHGLIKQILLEDLRPNLQFICFN